MISTWFLMVLLANGDVLAVPQESELRCDAERRAIAAEAERVCVLAGSPFPIAAKCQVAFVTPELLEDGQ